MVIHHARLHTYLGRMRIRDLARHITNIGRGVNHHWRSKKSMCDKVGKQFAALWKYRTQDIFLTLSSTVVRYDSNRRHTLGAARVQRTINRFNVQRLKPLKEMGSLIEQQVQVRTAGGERITKKFNRMETDSTRRSSTSRSTHSGVVDSYRAT